MKRKVTQYTSSLLPIEQDHWLTAKNWPTLPTVFGDEDTASVPTPPTADDGLSSFRSPAVMIKREVKHLEKLLLKAITVTN